MHAYICTDKIALYILDIYSAILSVGMYVPSFARMYVRALQPYRNYCTYKNIKLGTIDHHPV